MTSNRSRSSLVLNSCSNWSISATKVCLNVQFRLRQNNHSLSIAWSPENRWVCQKSGRSITPVNSLEHAAANSENMTNLMNLKLKKSYGGDDIIVEFASSWDISFHIKCVIPGHSIGRPSNLNAGSCLGNEANRTIVNYFNEYVEIH